MHAGGAFDSADEEDPLANETHIRVLDITERRPFGFEIQAISEPRLYIVRARVDKPGELTSSSRIELDDSRIGPISRLRFRDLSPVASDSIIDEIVSLIEADPERHLNFYNRANAISLKIHAFQLLSGIGSSKAQKMVQSRGGAGWMSFEEVDAACEIDSIRLLAERYHREMEDPSNNLRLLDLMIRTDD
ncbi:MAG: hypothetical protein CMA61_00695 [Euryarchaeota archaeon]|jgi:predicted nucleic acid-binding OB-fold protein|nr:hypothetical protein [Euryarchaeota archaeon]|tara:strand:- start:832 stop:1401 length:570 start_codon:yes stop_codon:yes gene_type:complete